MEKAILAQNILWVANFMFFLSLFYQAKLNFKLKSTNGLSEIFLLMYFNGYVFTLFYVFCLGLPIAYKIIVPLSALTLCVIVFQRFYYSKINNKKMLKIYFFNIFLALCLIYWARIYPEIIGITSGWIAITIWAIYQIPQAIKNFVRKSTHGLSFAWVTFIVIGNSLELVSAIILGLPAPTHYNAYRSILIYIVFALQFWFYRKENLINKN